LCRGQKKYRMHKPEVPNPKSSRINAMIIALRRVLEGTTTYT
jgi:hypothetical protein